ncbi:hypothetical protein D5085_13215 [Ectothiorhodospiraceae bacterium BW-2]|nr:hypothetical protein D5085_13215 [Ectothiorhodospiraceae bacterium BW-2]
MSVLAEPLLQQRFLVAEESDAHSMAAQIIQGALITDSRAEMAPFWLNELPTVSIALDSGLTPGSLSVVVAVGSGASAITKQQEQTLASKRETVGWLEELQQEMQELIRRESI